MSSTLSPERWLEHFDAWEQTTQTKTDYCRTHKISLHQFNYWKRKLQSQSSVTRQSTTTAFAVAQFETVSTSNQALSVTLPNGTILNDICASNIHVAAQLLEVLR